MSQPPPPSDRPTGGPRIEPADGSTDARVVIVVVRTGGIAGIRREWQVEPEPAEAPEWISMVDDCPWDADEDAERGADRFVWVIRVRTPEQRRERELPDSALDGPWRALVDAVRAASA
ncbi:protealysin inhibitor emfourin [Microbacterium sp. GCS4]|uniref:protealysin inhibitor emfourin n=1 Tax=Microbacterium sp. GCS4 TaxID=1692239 RepID=UPI001F335782|nr:protealysin inhibitor emfourin [Microbacterium sp. GCS4]